MAYDNWEVIFHCGIGIICAAVLIGMTASILLFNLKKKLNYELESDYGKRRR